MQERDEGRRRGAGLALAALGVVYGDIGTSPLYALRECLIPPHGVAPAPETVLGVLSLVFWSLTLVVTVKYLVFILRADNRGEGGILALLALVPERETAPGRPRLRWVAALGLAGAALLFGDGVITPAISVLSAVEGLAVAAAPLRAVIVPLTAAILLCLFALQRRGTGSVGRLFGPVMVVWFATLAGLGSWHVIAKPSVLAAVWPGHAVRFFAEHGGHGFRLLGSVVLTVTGGEALYADLGHFGRRPIRRAWLAVVYPALLLAYFGQGAMLLEAPEIAGHVFFAMAPGRAGAAVLVVLATAATVIASQALISGAFSLVHQAVQLGWFPRVTVRHTSSQTEGQIYVPEVNWGLALGSIGLVVAFGESSRLAAAYGIAVSGTMAVTSILFYAVVREAWGWSRARAVPLLLLFLALDLPFFLANLLKFADGGWVPVAIGGAVFVVMVVWNRGRILLAGHLARRSLPWDQLVEVLGMHAIQRTPGVGVFLASSLGTVPPFLIHHARRVRALPERVVAVTVEVRHTPSVAEAERLSVEALGAGVHRVVARCGFMERPSIPALLQEAVDRKLLAPFEADRVTYYLGRETILAGSAGQMGRLAESLFAFLNRNARNASSHFGLPPDQVVEVGAHIDL